MLLVYLRKLMQRLSSLTAKMEAQHLVTLDELRRLRAEVNTISVNRGYSPRRRRKLRLEE